MTWRKFNTLEVDGGKRVRRVDVKISGVDGEFLAVLDGVSFRSDSLKELTRLLGEAAAKADDVTYSAYYVVSVGREKRIDIEAVALSDEAIYVEGCPRSERPRQRMFKLRVKKDLRVHEVRNSGQLIGDPKGVSWGSSHLLNVSEGARKALLMAQGALQELADEECALERRSRLLNRAISTALKAVKANTSDSEIVELFEDALRGGHE